MALALSPTYKQIQYLILHPTDPNYKEIMIDLYSEYGEFNHECCKVIFQNLRNSDRSIVKEQGAKIGKRGGLTAMQNNYYVLFKYWSANIGSETTVEEKLLVRELQNDWDGICGWQN